MAINSLSRHFLYFSILLLMGVSFGRPAWAELSVSKKMEFLSKQLAPRVLSEFECFVLEPRRIGGDQDSAKSYKVSEIERLKIWAKVSSGAELNTSLKKIERVFSSPRGERKNTYHSRGTLAELETINGQRVASAFDLRSISSPSLNGAAPLSGGGISHAISLSDSKAGAAEAKLEALAAPKIREHFFMYPADRAALELSSNPQIQTYFGGAMPEEEKRALGEVMDSFRQDGSFFVGAFLMLGSDREKMMDDGEIYRDQDQDQMSLYICKDRSAEEAQVDALFKSIKAFDSKKMRGIKYMPKSSLKSIDRMDQKKRVLKELRSGEITPEEIQRLIDQLQIQLGE